MNIAAKRAFPNVPDHTAARFSKAGPFCVRETAWEPTPDELMKLKRGASLIVGVAGYPSLTFVSVSEPPESPELPGVDARLERRATIVAEIKELIGDLDLDETAQIVGCLLGEYGAVALSHGTGKTFTTAAVEKATEIMIAMVTPFARMARKGSS